ncbi:GntR family transcriptional regulator [Janthinobacterium sp. GB4P2]|uniref:GntR family transcriptional regulator n=1 Tax=Janthinobacterium sp. GB4P2 TaxID=3424189 RepID=UPI003F27A2A0
MNSASSNLTNNATAASGAVSPTASTPATPVAAAAGAPVTVVVSSNTTAAMPVASASPTFSPLYQQIKALITQSLQSGEWKPGELIPSEVELAGRFKVSQGTVRKAIDELAAENLVMRRQGKGTFVSTHHEARAHFRFLRLVPDEGVPHYPESKFIEVKRVRAPADVARLMDLKSGDAVIFIKRVQYFDGVPTIVEELWLPGLIFKGLTAERLVEYKGPMYGLFETEFGTRMIRASEQIRAVCADAGAAQLLNIDLGTPLLSSERVSFTYGDKPVELRRGLYLTSRHHYQNELS